MDQDAAIRLPSAPIASQGILPNANKADVPLPPREALLAATLRSIGDAVITTDPVGRVTFLNPVAENLTGWSVADAAGRPAGEVFHIINEETRALVESPIQRVLKEGRIVGLANHTVLVARDGSERPIDDSGAPILGEDGSLVGVVLVFRDMTEKLRDEREMQRLNRTLTALSHSNHALVRVNTEQEYLEAICRIIVEDCGHTMVWIGLAEDDERKTVRPVASAGFEEGYLETLHINWADTKRGQGPTGTAIRTARPCGCADMLTDPGFAPWRDEATKRGYASSMVIPLVTPSRVLGAISLYARTPNAFSEREIELLCELAQDVAHGILTIRQNHARKRAEALLLESEARYRELFENMTEEVHFWQVVRDAAGEIQTWRLVDANPPATATWGRNSIEEIRGKTTDEIFGPGATEHYMPVVRKIMEDGAPHSFEDYFPNLDKHFRFTSVPLGEHFITTGADITSIRKAHDVLEQRVEERTSELRLAHAAVDSERQRFKEALDQLPAYVLLLSPDYHVPFANRFFEERFGKSDGRRCFEYLFNRDRPCEVCETYRVLQTNEPLHWEWTGPDNRNYDIYDFPFTDSDGSPLIMEVGLDVTERKQGEAEIARYREHLEELVRERTTEVNALNVRLQRAMAETHHRVKNNLQTIAALIDMQRMTEREVVPASELERLSRHVRGLASIHDLLTQEARANGDVDSISVQQALEKLKPLLDNMVGGRELRFEVGELRLPIRLATGLAVLVNELVSNAVKHGDGAIDLSLQVAPEGARLAVRDHGPGFPPGFRAESAANTGLELVQSVGTWDLQGQVEFGNAPDGGARVTVHFPLAKHP